MSDIPSQRPPRGPDEAELKRFLAAASQSYVPRWLDSLVSLGFFIFLVVDRETTARVLDLSSGSFGTVLLWTLVAFAAAGASTFFTHTYIGPMLFYARTGISYREDRMAYARAGGYDFDRLVPRLALIGLFGVLWATSDSTSDPVGFVRSGWGYALSTFVVTIVLTIAVCIVGFRLTTPGRH